MDKRNRFFVFIVLVCFLVLSNVVYSQGLIKKAAEETNKIIMMVTLPDGTKFKATVSENQDLVISTSDALTKFSPTVVDFEKKLVNMVTFETSGDFSRILNNGEKAIEFEILDIMKVSNKLSNVDSCTTCCFTCGDFTACACAVYFPECRKGCCCGNCCDTIKIE